MLLLPDQAKEHNTASVFAIFVGGLCNTSGWSVQSQRVICMIIVGGRT